LLRCSPTLANVKNAPLDPRNIHKIPQQNDSYPARGASRPVADRRMAGETGMLGPFLPCMQFALSPCRVRQNIVPAPPPLPWRISRKRDPMVVAFLARFFCAVAVR
jgi:hypothetical protein